LTFIRLKVDEVTRGLWFSGPLQGEDSYIPFEEMLRASGLGEGAESRMVRLIIKSLPQMADVHEYLVLEFKREGFEYVKDL